MSNFYFHLNKRRRNSGQNLIENIKKWRTDCCYNSKRKIECTWKFPLCTGFMWLIFNNNFFKVLIFFGGYIVLRAHIRFSRSVLFAQKIFCVRFERVEYGRTNQQIAIVRKTSMKTTKFKSFLFYLNVETISVKVRTFCFFIVASSTHRLGQHSTSGKSVRIRLYSALDHRANLLLCLFSFVS